MNEEHGQDAPKGAPPVVPADTTEHLQAEDRETSQEERPRNADEAFESTIAAMETPASLAAATDAVAGDPTVVPKSKAQRKLPEIPGYEVLRLLGQGGMSLVYAARHQKLDRIVALKMLRSGITADAEELERFQDEARAVARLQHSNIVQIFEVGQHNNLPYFALEFVDGSDLHHRFSRQPQPPREAAGVLKDIARAMQFAHEQGIVHRDLKPANVLLDQRDVLKITDFGLAKRLDVESGYTASGTIAGTVHYMAPEQARGDSKSVGPAADVYAMGAILYEALTGRPPFVGASAMDIVLRVIDEDPIPPRRLVPKIPRDLETICLKCLEKPPARRYESADALASDLHRFLEGKPIDARPVSFTEKTYRWCKRKPAFAAAVSLAFLILVGGWGAAFAYRYQRDRADTFAIEATDNAKRADQEADHAEERTYHVIEGMRHWTIAVNRKLMNYSELDNVREDILTGTVEWLDKFPQTEATGPRADRSLAAYHQQMGDLLLETGNATEANDHYQKAYAIVQRMYAAHSADPRYVRNLAVMKSNLARLEKDPQQREPWHQEALELRKRWNELQPNSVGARQAVANSYTKIAELRFDGGDVDGAQAAALEAQQWWQRIPDSVLDRSDSVQLRRELNSFHTFLGKLYLHNHDDEAAQEHLTKALRYRQTLLESDPDNHLLIHDVAIGHSAIGDFSLLSSQDYAVAEQAYRSSAERFTQYRDWAANNPRPLRQANRDLAKVLYRLGTARLKRGADTKADTDFRRGLELLKSLDNPTLSERVDLMLAAGRCGEIELANQSAQSLLAHPQAGNHPKIRYAVACGYALCAGAVGRDANDEDHSPEELADQKHYTDLALANLHKAVEGGWNDQFELSANPELDALRGDERFTRLLD